MGSSAQALLLAIVFTFGWINTTVAAIREKPKLSTPKGVKHENNIRNIDFENFTYPPRCSNKPVKVVNGTLNNTRLVNGWWETIDDSLPSYFSVEKTVYGDINGDGREEAIVEVLCNTGGTGQFTSAFVFAMKRGKPVVVAELEEGDRGFGGIVDLEIINNVLVVTRNEGHTSNCCGDFIVTTRFRLSKTNKLVIVGKPKREKFEDYWDDP